MNWGRVTLVPAQGLPLYEQGLTHNRKHIGGRYEEQHPDHRQRVLYPERHVRFSPPLKDEHNVPFSFLCQEQNKITAIWVSSKFANHSPCRRSRTAVALIANAVR